MFLKMLPASPLCCLLGPLVPFWVFVTAAPHFMVSESVLAVCYPSNKLPQIRVLKQHRFITYLTVVDIKKKQLQARIQVSVGQYFFCGLRGRSVFGFASFQRLPAFLGPWFLPVPESLCPDPCFIVTSFFLTLTFCLPLVRALVITLNSPGSSKIISPVFDS